jgi:hypothetical protein
MPDMHSQRTVRASGEKDMTTRAMSAMRGFCGTVLLGALLFGVPFALLGMYRGVLINSISAQYDGKDGKPITSFSVFVDHCGAGAFIGGLAGVIPGLFVAFGRLKRSASNE